MARSGTDGRSREAKRKVVGTESKKAMAAPLLAAGMPHASIAALLRVTLRTVARWAGDDAVKADVASVVAKARESAEDRIEGIVSKAFDAIEASLGSDDDRVKLDAAKTVLDRFGYPVSTSTTSTSTVNGSTAVRVMLVRNEDDLRRLARGED